MNDGTYSALGYMQTLTGELTNAVESFYNMPSSVIEQLMNFVASFPGFHNTTPRFLSLTISRLMQHKNVG